MINIGGFVVVMTPNPFFYTNAQCLEVIKYHSSSNKLPFPFSYNHSRLHEFFNQQCDSTKQHR